MSHIVSALTWVAKGKFAPFPIDARVLARQNAEDDEEKPDAAAATTTATTTTAGDAEMGEEEAVIKEYHMEEYDEEEGMPATGETYYKEGEEDPDLVDMENGSDVEENAVLDSDQFVLGACTDVQDEYSHLDVHLYEDDDRNLFCHHDYMLPAFPLAIAHIEDATPAAAAVGAAKMKNLCAVGTFEPGIDVWDLDVLECVEPVVVLGGPKGEGGARGTGKKKKKQPALKDGSHTDSVLCLSWNALQRTVLASGSADSTVKLWDVPKSACLHTFRQHKQDSKVQSCEWLPTEASVLLSAGFDKRACVIDVRSDAATLEWALSSDPESAAWLPVAPGSSSLRFLVACEDGSVKCFDARTASKPLWTLAAHDQACNALSVSKVVPGLIATGSLDRTVKLWSVGEGQPPSCIYSRNEATEVFSAAFSTEEGSFLLALGTGNGVRVWDTSELAAVRNAFGLRRRRKPEPRDVEEGGESKAAAAASPEEEEFKEIVQEVDDEAEKEAKEAEEEQRMVAQAPVAPPAMKAGSRRVIKSKKPKKLRLPGAPKKR